MKPRCGALAAATLAASIAGAIVLAAALPEFGGAFGNDATPRSACRRDLGRARRTAPLPNELDGQCVSASSSRSRP